MRRSGFSKLLSKEVKVKKNVALTQNVCLQAKSLEEYFWSAAQKGGDNSQWSVNELLPLIRVIVEKYNCRTAVEFGTAQCRTSCAMLMGGVDKLQSYDVERDPVVDHFEALTEAEGKDWCQILADSGDVQIPVCDVLFIDTMHYAEHLTNELQVASSVRKIIVLHDTTTYWEDGDDGKDGLRYAVEPFLHSKVEWELKYRFSFNNGLMVLENKGWGDA
jgi:hypothetical protein